MLLEFADAAPFSQVFAGPILPLVPRGNTSGPNILSIILQQHGLLPLFFYSLYFVDFHCLYRPLCQPCGARRRLLGCSCSGDCYLAAVGVCICVHYMRKDAFQQLPSPHRSGRQRSSSARDEHIHLFSSTGGPSRPLSANASLCSCPGLQLLRR